MDPPLLLDIQKEFSGSAAFGRGNLTALGGILTLSTRTYIKYSTSYIAPRTQDRTS